jgi:uncharacterized membrane protein
MKKIGKYFLQGLVVLIPVLVSVYVVYAVFVYVDGLLGIPVPGVGFLLTVFLIAVIGFLANNFLTRWIFNLPEKIFTRLPLVKILYT